MSALLGNTFRRLLAIFYNFFSIKILSSKLNTLNLKIRKLFQQDLGCSSPGAEQQLNMCQGSFVSTQKLLQSDFLLQQLMR